VSRGRCLEPLAALQQSISQGHPRPRVPDTFRPTLRPTTRNPLTVATGAANFAGMGRSPRTNLGGHVYHVLNRANARSRIFENDGDYAAFESVLEEATRRFQMRLLSYCVMPNHWHLVVYPRNDGDHSRFTGWLTLTHTQRWHTCHGSTGTGPLYQGRFKSFAAQSGEHLLAVCRYVERNPLRAGLVRRAEQWKWNSLWRREYGVVEQQSVLSDWPVSRPTDWLRRVNVAETAGELAAIRVAVARGFPFGDAKWRRSVVERLR